MHPTVKTAAVLLVLGCTGAATRIAADAAPGQPQPPGQTGLVDAETLESAGSGPGGGTAGAGGSSSMGGANAGGGTAGTMGQATGGTGGVGTSTGGTTAAGGSVEQWHPVDIALGGTSTSQISDSVSATFSGPGGENLSVPGFFDGTGWKVRFSPTAPGAWSYRTISTVSGVSGKTGTLTCVANTNPLVHGRVMVDAAHPHAFIYENGTQYIMMGFEADWLGLMDFGDPQITHARSLIDIYTNRGFNEALMNVFAYDTTWNSGKTSADDYGPTAELPWKGTYAATDYTQMNPTFFDSYDRVIQYMFEHGVVAHIMFKVYNKNVNWPAKGSPEDDLYFTHVLARYQAYPNILWDFSKESNNETDVAYKSGRIKMIHAKDAYHHPVSTHTDDGYYSNSASSGLLEFRTDQNQSNWYATIIAHRNANSWPVINSEFQYECGNDGGRTYGVCTDKLSVLKDACEVAMAGGYFNYYYTYHAWDVVRSTEVPNGLSYYGNVFKVLSATKWSQLSPSDALINNAGLDRHCLANPGAEYLVYLGAAGTATLTVGQVAPSATLSGKWVDLITGAEQAIAALGNGQATLTNPWTDPAMAHLAP
jgi:hypothetical protein